MIQYQDFCSNEFYLLDDLTSLDTADKVFQYIKQYGYSTRIITMHECVKYLSYHLNKFSSDKVYIVSIGKGGEILLRLLKEYFLYDFSCLELTYSQIIVQNRIIGYNTNFENYNWYNKNILVIEDIIYTGNTIIDFINRLINNGGTLIGVLSCIACVDCDNKLPHIRITSKYLLSKKNKKLPPVYSYRHLLYGEGNYCEFYENIEQLYFGGEEKIRKIISKE